METRSPNQIIGTGFTPVALYLLTLVAPTSSASSINVTARIVESTCALQVSSGSSGTVDLGDWTYSAMGASSWQLTPVTSSGVGTGSAASTVSIDPSCNTIGMAALTIIFPGVSAPSAVNTISSTKWPGAYGSGPVFALQATDGRSAFPVWVDVLATQTPAVTNATVTCQPASMPSTAAGGVWGLTSAAAGGQKGLQYGIQAGINLKAFKGHYFNTGSWLQLPPPGVALYNLYNPAALYNGSSTEATRTIAQGQIFVCYTGVSEPARQHGLNPFPGVRAADTSYQFRFTGPRTIPANGWPTPPPPPGTQYSGTITLSMTYL